MTTDPFIIKYDNAERFDEAMAAVLKALKVPVECWPLLYTLSTFADGRTEFTATDEELAEHRLKLIDSGKMIGFLKQAAIGTSGKMRKEIRKVIREERSI
jgi:hypothetical protein